MYLIFSMHSTVEGQLGCFQLLPITNMSSMNLLEHVPPKHSNAWTSLRGPESQCLYMFCQEQNSFKAMSCWKNLSHWVWAIKFSASWKAVSARTIQMKMYTSQFCLHHACLDGVMLSCFDDTWQNLYTCKSAPNKCLSQSCLVHGLCSQQ